MHIPFQLRLINRHFIYLFAALWLLSTVGSQSFAQQNQLYFPDTDATWASVKPQSAGWDEAKLSAALDIAGSRNSSGVVILHNGRIMAERYWPADNMPPNYANFVSGTDVAGRVIEDVASAQKSVVAVLVGIAQERDYLNIDDKVSQYLAAGWSEASPDQESVISIKHLLSMSSGLANDLSFESEPDSKWFYNTPAYHLLMPIVTAASGQSRDQITRDWLTVKLGMENTSWTPRPWASADIAVGLSTSARDLARFGLMIQAGGRWQNETIINAGGYLQDMLNSSQADNPAYGYLWWLNGKESSRAAGARASLSSGPLIAAAPADLVAMQGAQDRKLYLVPSLGLVVARLGASGRAGGKSFNDAFWEALIQAKTVDQQICDL